MNIYLLSISFVETFLQHPSATWIVLFQGFICLGLIMYIFHLKNAFRKNYFDLKATYKEDLARIREEVNAYQLDTTRMNRIIEDILADKDPQTGRPESADELLLSNAIRYVRDNIENPDVSVEDMSRKLGLSRTHLHRKLKALTGQSPVEFIKIIRMKQAATWLETGNLSVSEVSYKVGYNSPSYFSSSFTSFFGIPPSTYIENSIKNVSPEQEVV